MLQEHAICLATYSVQNIHKCIAVNHHSFYKSRQQMLHVSVITSHPQALDTWYLWLNKKGMYI